MYTYLYSIYIIKNHEFNNVSLKYLLYVNNHKFLLIVGNVIVLQLSLGLFDSHKNLPRADL